MQIGGDSRHRPNLCRRVHLSRLRLQAQAGPTRAGMAQLGYGAHLQQSGQTTTRSAGDESVSTTRSAGAGAKMKKKTRSAGAASASENMKPQLQHHQQLQHLSRSSSGSSRRTCLAARAVLQHLRRRRLAARAFLRPLWGRSAPGTVEWRLVARAHCQYPTAGAPRAHTCRG